MSTPAWALHTNRLALRKGRSSLGQQDACESVLPHELGVMHVPVQQAPLLPQLVPVVPASRQSGSWVGQPVSDTSLCTPQPCRRAQGQATRLCTRDCTKAHSAGAAAPHGHGWRTALRQVVDAIENQRRSGGGWDSHLGMHCACMAVSKDLRPVATEVLQMWLESQHVFDDPEPQTLALAPAQTASALSVHHELAAASVHPGSIAVRITAVGRLPLHRTQDTETRRAPGMGAWGRRRNRHRVMSLIYKRASLRLSTWHAVVRVAQQVLLLPEPVQVWDDEQQLEPHWLLEEPAGRARELRSGTAGRAI